MGGIIAPPVPAFYARPQNLSQMVDHSLGRVLDLFGLDAGTALRWGEPGPSATGQFATTKELA
ncbi:Phenolic acid decarboxylase subunit B [compost metagenome]